MNDFEGNSQNIKENKEFSLSNSSPVLPNNRNDTDDANDTNAPQKNFEIMYNIKHDEVNNNEEESFSEYTNDTEDADKVDNSEEFSEYIYSSDSSDSSDSSYGSDLQTKKSIKTFKKKQNDINEPVLKKRKVSHNKDIIDILVSIANNKLTNNNLVNNQLINNQDENEIILKTKKETDILNKIKQKQKELQTFENSKTQIKLSLSDQVLLSNQLSLSQKSIILFKLNNSSGEEHCKYTDWVNNLLKIPFGVYKKLPISINSSKTEIKNYLINVKQNLDKYVFGLEEAKSQILSFLVKKILNPHAKGNVLALCGPKGTAKCLHPDTKIVMANGAYKKIKHVRDGDFVLGDDSTPREVLAANSGRDDMYEIHNKYGKNYIVNKEHILCLKNIITKSIIQISVKEFIKWPKLIQKLYRGYRNSIELPFVNTNLNAYEEGLRYNGNFKLNYKLIYNNYHTRLNYLIGLLQYEKTNFSKYINSNKTFRLYSSDSKNLYYLINSLGFTIIDYYDNIAFIKLKNLTEPVNIKYIGEGYYNGIFISGNQRFLLEDFYVTHNTRLVKKGISENLNLPFYSINFGGLSDSSYLTGHSYTYIGSTCGIFTKALMSTECMNPVIYLDECFPYNQLIDTNKGLISIGNLYKMFKNNDTETLKIKSFNEELKKFEYKNITNAWQKYHWSFFELEFDNNFITSCTENHLFLTQRGYIKASELVINRDKILSCNKDTQEYKYTILKNKIYSQKNNEPVYDIEIQDNHNFVISNKNCDFGLVVHNCDKVDPNKHEEIYGVLTHLLDEEQNHQFQDFYFKDINLDFSKTFFVLSFNDEEKINHITRDRMRVIYIDKPNLLDQIKICQNIIIPEILEENKNIHLLISFDENVIKYIINNTEENNMRQIKDTFKKIIEQINLSFLTEGLYHSVIYNKFIQNNTISVNDVNIVKILAPQKKLDFINHMYS